jgi:carboxyl-terminal processing protease
MSRPSRPILLAVSAAVAVFLLAGGLALKVGASEDSYHQAKLFAEVLSLVLDNYVDPVEVDTLLRGAYEGMLGGLDAHGAFLTPEEVREWKSYDAAGRTAHPGLSVLKAGRGLEVVAVAEGSPAAEASIQIGDQIRGIDGQAVSDLALDQCLRRIQGTAGTTVAVDLLHPADGFRRETLELRRVLDRSQPYALEMRDDVAVLHLHDLGRLPTDAVLEELDGARSRGAKHLLLDLRNVADTQPRQVTRAAELFVPAGTLLWLRDRSGRLLESVEARGTGAGWPGPISTLVNGATAGSAEALAVLLRVRRDARVLGEPTYGLGAEPRLYELEDGSGLLVSAALWEAAAGQGWNERGVEPDEVVHGLGADLAQARRSQLDQALERVREARAAEPTRDAA